ncbi:MAG: DUF1080 domain-containing protein [Planctomycetes bacterium]|nr:DUF1080 domain-containing protein [Planctomycetota bacterium]
MRCAFLLLLLACSWVAAQESAPGYNDTPLLRTLGGVELPWRVHDSSRARPARVDGVRCVEVPAPKDAVVLFDGISTAAWRSGDAPARWPVRAGSLCTGKGDLRSAESFSDAQIHLEWCASVDDQDHGQQRSNSGLFLMDRYEVQILESHGSITYADGQAAALYGQWPPLVNACVPAGQWNSYDIVFRAPRFSVDGKLSAPARVTVLHNGVVVHLDRAFLGATAHKTLPSYSAHGPAPLRLQDHGDLVSFRNIWLRKLEALEEQR